MMSPSLAWMVLILDSADAATLGLLVVSLCIAFLLGRVLLVNVQIQASTKAGSMSSRPAVGEERYVGERDKDGRRSGMGTMFYSDGSIYEGDWYKDMPWGKGKARSANGDVYDGEWRDDERHGRGSMSYAGNDGQEQERYEGEWADGKMHGRGKYVYEDGSVYEGMWALGKMHGKGVVSPPCYYDVTLLSLLKLTHSLTHSLTLFFFN